MQHLLIDVRTPLEFSQGHLKNALNIEYQLIETAIQAIAPDLSCSIQLYCTSGQRSEFAKKILENLGYFNAENIGGYEMLKAAGFEVIEP